MDDINTFIEKFLIAVDFQEAVSLTAETPLAELKEWDSLAALGVIIMFDTEYSATLTGNDLKNCATIGDIYALAASKK